MSKINTLKLNKDGSIGLGRILKGTNVDKNDVEYYTIEREDKTIILTLYDKNKKPIHVKEK